MALSFGPCISAQEYQKRILSVYEGMDPKPSASQSQFFRRQEFEIQVDHRLGVQFPKERRVLLFKALEKTYRFGIFSFLILYIAHLLRLSHENKVVQGEVKRKFTGVSRAVARVLSPEELDAFLGDGHT